MNTLALGKISKVKFGFGGYQDAAVGLTLQFEFQGSGIGDFMSAGWSGKRPETAKWTEESRNEQRAVFMAGIDQLLQDAKCDDVMQLLGKPVEVMIENNALKSWRILKEVL